MGTYTSFSLERKRIYKFVIKKKNNTISPLGGAGGSRNNYVIWACNISLLYGYTGKKNLVSLLLHHNGFFFVSSHLFAL